MATHPHSNPRRSNNASDMFTSAIRHPANASFVQIHEWQLAATEGDKTAAALLSVFEHRHNSILHNREFDILIRDAADRAGFPLVPDYKYWFCFTDDQLVYRVKIAKKEAILKAIDILRTKGFISTDVPDDLRDLVGSGRRKWFWLDTESVNDFIEYYRISDGNVGKSSRPPQNTATAAAKPAVTSIVTGSTTVQEIFDDWKTIHESPRSVLDPKRARLVANLLKLGYTPDRLRLAIRGICTLEHNMGGTNGRLYNQFELIFRDAEHVERYEAAAIECGVTTDNFQQFTISKSAPFFVRIAPPVAKTVLSQEDRNYADLLAWHLATGATYMLIMQKPPDPMTDAFTQAVYAAYSKLAPLDAAAKTKINNAIDKLRKRQNES